MGISGKFYELIENYLSGTFQRVILNGQISSWKYYLGPLLFLIYINDLPNGLKTSAKLFADNASLFTIVKDKNEIANALTNDLSLISKWAFN